MKTWRKSRRIVVRNAASLGYDRRWIVASGTLASTQVVTTRTRTLSESHDLLLLGFLDLSSYSAMNELKGIKGTTELVTLHHHH